MLAPALVLCLASGNGRAVGGLILTFHRVGVHKVDVLSWVTYAPSTTDLLRVIASLHDTGFTFVTVSELLAAVAAEPDDQLRPALAAITFDDGDASVARAALPALLSVGVRATVFVVTERLGLPGSLTREELLDLKAAGWEVGSHSASHPYLPDLTAEAMRRELDVAAITLEDLIGPGPRCFAYPFGGHDARVRSMVAQFHACAVTTAPGLAASRMELLAMPRPSSSGLDGRGVGWRAGRGLDPLSLIVSGALMGGLWPGVPGGAASPPPRWQPATWRGLGYGSYEIGYREGAISETLGLRDGRWSLQAWRSRALTPAAGSGAALAAARSFGDLTVAAAWVTGERWGVGLALDLDEQGEAWAWWTAGGGWRFGLEALLADAVRLSTSWRSADDRFTAELWAALPWWPEEGRPLSVALGVDQALYARLAGRVGSHELALSADAHGRMAAALLIAFLVLTAAIPTALGQPQNDLPEPTRGKVALVLGGGAARGVAHVGVIRALTDAGVPIDMILGTSMGSLIGGLYAAGFAVDILAEVVAEVDPTSAAELLLPPRGGILDLQPLSILLDGLLEGRELADTVVPFYPVVIDLLTGEPQAAPAAPLADAIRASTAIPVLFDPVPIGDRYYYDGGLKQTIPTSLARSLGADYVIAVDVTREIPYLPTNVQANLSRIFISIVEEYNHEELANTDVVLDPGLRDNSYMDFGHAAGFVLAGEAVTVAELPRILADLEAMGIPLRPAGDPNADHPLNEGWRARLALARREVVVRPRPLNLGIDLGFDPVATGERVTPAPAPVGSRLRFGVDLQDGVLGRLSLGASYARSVTGGSDAAQLRLGARLDPAWRLFARGHLEFAGGWQLRTGVDWQPSPAWAVELAVRLPRPALEGTVRWRGQGLWLETAASVGQGGWLRGHLEARAAIAGSASAWAPWELRTRAFVGAASATTPTVDRFSVGPATGLRGTVPDAWTASTLVVGSVEVARRLSGDQAVLEAATIAPWAWAFVDGALFDAGAEAPRSAWAVGVGAGLDGSLFGFVPFSLGMDLGYGLPAGRLVLGWRLGQVYPSPWRF